MVPGINRHPINPAGFHRLAGFFVAETAVFARCFLAMASMAKRLHVCRVKKQLPVPFVGDYMIDIGCNSGDARLLAIRTERELL